MGDKVKTAPPEPSDCFDENVILGQYLLWEDTVDLFYDTMSSHTLQSPSMTAQWLPDVTASLSRKESFHRLIVGTQSEVGENYLIVARITLPSKPPAILPPKRYGSNYDPNIHGEFSGARSRSPSTSEPAAASGSDLGKLDVELKIVHDGAVVRARCMPQNPSLIATRTLAHDVLVYNYWRYQYNEEGKSDTCLELRLKGHTNLGKGLSWNPTRSGHLLSASEDNTICLWDINSTAKENRVINASSTYTAHTAEVRDVAWQNKDINMFGSVADDKKIMLWDVRCQLPNYSVISIEAHPSAATCISFNHFNENTFLTGMSDWTIPLWDIRNLEQPLQCLTGHQGAVTQVEWCPNNETVFASAATDRQIRMWDLSRTGMEMPLDVDEPPELIFVHGGHMTNVADFGWNPTKSWLMCSVAENHDTLQIWQMANSFSNYQQFHYGA